MAEERAKRINDALSSLVDSLIPVYPDDDEEVADERHDNALELARHVVESGASSAQTTDVNHAADLIKKKLLRENASPDPAVKFSNLYSRLLTQPVLSQKWAILYLLYQLSGSSMTSSTSSAVQDILRRSTIAQPMSPKVASRLSRGTELHDASPSQQSSPRLPPKEIKSSLKHDDSDRRRPRAAREAAPPSSSKETVKVTHSVTEEGPSEAMLLRDLPFTFQGLSSSHLEFASSTTLNLPITLPISMVSLLNTVAEPSLLYRRLSEFVQTSEGGLMGQSLRAAVGKELRNYLGVVTSLESRIRHALAVSKEGNKNKAILVTLKRCVIWTRDATLGLRLMSIMVEESKNRQGGQLISMVHNFSTSYGDPFVIAFAERLLKPLTRPFYAMLRQWIYDGELSDPYHEFFVTESSGVEVPADPRRLASSVWETKYRIDESLIPSIITPSFAQKVFLIGKSLNFIRYGCADSTWVEEHSKRSSRDLEYGDTATLEASIDDAYKTTMARLIYLMDVKFHLFSHLNGLKKYLLLGQGDFIALLMESLAPNLDRPANSQYRHTLTAQLEHAIRASNAQFESDDVLRRLDARMLPPQHGDIGWDCFTLDYKIDAPVDVVITPWGNTQYLKMFNFLWRIKRVEFALGSIWRRCMTGARGVLSTVEDKVGQDWKAARGSIAEMIHFVNQLQYYILFEVIEASWDQLQIAIHKPECTLDDLIEAHSKYLTSITHKGLLGSSSRSRGEDSFLEQLHQILKLMLVYKDAVEGLYSFSVADFTRRQELSAKMEANHINARWGAGSALNASSASTPTDTDGPVGAADELGISTALPASDDHLILPSLRARLQHLTSDFRVRVNILLGDLAYQPDVDMRFLGVVMNFNDVYTPVRRKRRLVGGTDRKGKSSALASSSNSRTGSSAGTARKKDGEGTEGK
ncbi:MAG: Microtubule-nucleating Tub4p (gamma-tubulin) complex component [Cirrosporium novae-zelandiae]|nr:MAG: Microtubule-nucleating Tub4p (gamma-tubulin) complex component [Cirrosporium novae-zelandiae]